MTQIRIRSRVGADGVLHLDLPLGPGEANREVVVTVDPSAEGKHPRAPMSQDAWRDFIARTAGSIRDATLERPPQLDLREPESF